MVAYVRNFVKIMSTVAPGHENADCRIIFLLGFSFELSPVKFQNGSRSVNMICLGRKMCRLKENVIPNDNRLIVKIFTATK